MRKAVPAILFIAGLLIIGYFRVQKDEVQAAIDIANTQITPPISSTGTATVPSFSSRASGVHGTCVT